MAKQDAGVKDAILQSTIELIRKHGDTTRITVREIAAAAGVGVGLINYHYQTKDNLINLGILRIIGSSVEQMQSVRENAGMNPIDVIREIGKGIAGFMVENPGVSQISILHDLSSARTDDNSAQVASMLLPIVREYLGDGHDDQESLTLLHFLIASVEVAFLRRKVLFETTGMDFSDKVKRDLFIDLCISRIFPTNTAGN